MMNIKKKIFKLFPLVILALSNPLYAGIQLDTSRIIFEKGEKAVKYGVSNHYSVPALASAIVTTYDGKPTNAFAVSPSLFQIQPGATSQGQIIQLEELPQDKETVFWLKVKTVIADDKNKKDETEKNALEFAIAQNIKLFYRPKSVKDTCKYAANNLIFERGYKGVTVINNSKVSVSLVSVKEGDKEYKVGETIMPESRANLDILLSGSNFIINYVDEYGNFIDLPVEIK